MPPGGEGIELCLQPVSTLRIVRLALTTQGKLQANDPLPIVKDLMHWDPAEEKSRP